MSFWKTFREVMGKNNVSKQTLLPRKQTADEAYDFIKQIKVDCRHQFEHHFDGYEERTLEPLKPQENNFSPILRNVTKTGKS